MKKLLLILLLLPIFVNATLECSGDDKPNLATTYQINCSTRISLSRCFAVVSDVTTTPIIISYYPHTTFDEDRIAYNTFDNGRFLVSFYLDDKTYFDGRNYTAEIICFDPSDNSTNMTDFTFSPTIYTPPFFVFNWFNWLNANSIFLIVFFALLIISIVLIVLRAIL